MSEAAAALSALRVRDYMTTNIETLGPNDLLLDAELLIRRAGLRHIPVVSEGRVVGLLTERDVRRYAPSILDSTPDEYNRIFEQTTVGTVMTRQVRTIAPDAPLAEAVELLNSPHLGCLPVMENETLLGIITRRDLLRFAGDVLSGAR
jgi:CBS domain-containing protein